MTPEEIECSQDLSSQTLLKLSLLWGACLFVCLFVYGTGWDVCTQFGLGTSNSCEFEGVFTKTVLGCTAFTVSPPPRYRHLPVRVGTTTTAVQRALSIQQLRIQSLKIPESARVVTEEEG